MNNSKTLLRRLAAGIGAFALAAVGVVGIGAAAHADGDDNPPPPISQIDPNAEGSITVYKHVKDEDSTDNNPVGAPLEGVGFKLEEVLYKNASINLATAEGWALAESLFAAYPPLPTDYSVVDAGDGTTDGDGKLTFPDLSVGVYLVTETSSGGNLISEKAAPFLVAVPMPNDGSWNYDVVAYPKNVLGDFTPTKTVGDPSASVGLNAIVDWTVSATAPKSDLPYTEFSIADTLSPNLEFVEWKSVMVGSTPLDKDVHYQVLTGNTLSFLPDGLDELNALTATGDAAISAVISTKVISIPTSGVISNQANVSLNGNTKPTGEPSSNWGELWLAKASDDDKASVDGAQFELYAADKTTKLSEGTVTDGKIVWTVWVGNDEVTQRDFWLKETVPPAGHVLPADPWTPVTVHAGTVTQATITVTNHKPSGPELPLTGSTGTLAFSLLGIGLMAAGVATLAIRSRHANK